MIKIKHFLDAIEKDDGSRIWVEPFGLTRDLRQWCDIGYVLPHLGPPKKLWDWFQEHPDGYDYFRAGYHEALAKSTHRHALHALCSAARTENLTLVYEGDDPQHNTATALYEFLSALTPET